MYQLKLIKTKGMLVSVYRNCELPSSFRLLSTRFDRFVIVGQDVPEMVEASEDSPLLTLKIWEPHPDIAKNSKCGQKHLIAIPFGGIEIYSFGGNFIYSSDARFPSYWPIKIFDNRD